MAGNFSIGAGLELSGEKQFADAVKSINKDLSVLGSEMKKVTAQFDGNANSMEALTAKQKVYNERADEQRKKVELMTTALENAKKEYGENSDKVKDWQIKLNNAEADLAKTEKTLQSNEKAIKEYGKAQIQAAKDSEEFKKAQDKLKGAMNGLKVAAIAVTGAIVGFAGLAVKAGMAADDINTLAKQTGLTTEEIQKFQYATDLIDVPIETLTGSMAKLTKNMGTAQKGTGDAADAFKALGISITDQDGNLRDNQDVFNEAINALGKMENATQRDAYAMQIFGKSAQDLNPLILGGADDLKKYGEQAEKMGLILSQDALDGLNAINDKADELKGVFGLAGAAIVSEFAPQINEALASIDVGKIVEDIKGFINSIIENKDAILTALSAIAAGLLAWNVTSIVMSVVGAIKVFRDALITARVAQEGLNFAMKANVIGIVVTAVAALTAGLVVLWNTNDGFRDAVIGAWESLKTAASGLWETIKQFFTVDIPNAFNAIVTFFKTNWQNLLLLLVNPFAGALKMFYEMNPKFKAWVDELLLKFKEWVGGFINIGKNIVEGVWKGIQNAKAWLLGKIREWCGSILDGVKAFFGIQSPSKEFAKVGGYMAQGLGVGFEKEMAAVTKQINNSIPTDVTMTGQYQATAKMGEGIVNGLAGLMGGQANGGTYTINVLLDGKTVAQTVFDPLRNVAKQRGVALG